MRLEDWSFILLSNDSDVAGAVNANGTLRSPRGKESQKFELRGIQRRTDHSPEKKGGRTALTRDY